MGSNQGVRGHLEGNVRELKICMHHPREKHILKKKKKKVCQKHAYPTTLYLNAKNKTHFLPTCYDLKIKYP